MVSLAMRTASSSLPEYGITVSTGPKISSWAIRMSLLPTNTVGSKKKPFSMCSGRLPPVISSAPCSSPDST